MIRVFALFLIVLPNFSTAQSITSAGRITISSDQLQIGGFSGVEVLSDESLLIISDRGYFFTATAERADGEIQNAVFSTPFPILDSKGAALDGRNIDAEGLAVAENGDIYVSFESNHRVMLHENLNAAAQFLPKHDAFRALQVNSGLEALAINAEGILLAIPERSGEETRPFPVYAFDGEIWTQTDAIPRFGNFLVTGADFGPDGRLYLLERAYKLLAGFSMRVRRFTYSDGTLGNEEVLLESHAEKLDNMEGISVWSDQTGQTRMTLVSDDNFNPLLRTVIAEYLVND